MKTLGLLMPCFGHGMPSAEACCMRMQGNTARMLGAALPCADPSQASRKDCTA